MAKPFGNSKRPQFWLNLQSTGEFMAQLAEARNLASADLLIVSKGGNDISDTQGTWMHEDVAIEFARWLSPKFAIWCNDRIKELLQHGITAMPQTVDDIIADPDTTIKILTALKEERIAKEQALYQARQAEQSALIASKELDNTRKTLSNVVRELDTAKPKADYCDKVLTSESLISVRQIAKDFGKSAKWLNCFLKEHGIQYRQGRQWLLYAKYADMDYTRSVTATGAGRGEDRTFMLTKWTEKGRKFIVKLLAAFDYYPTNSKPRLF